MRQVLIIESPGLNDINTGDRRGELVERQLRLLRVPASLRSVATMSRFVEVLATENSARFDVLHVAMHGDHSGLELTDGSRLKWADMQFVALAAAKRVLILDACKSASFMPDGGVADAINQIVPGLTLSPPRFVLTMSGNVYFSDSVLAWGLFYSDLARTTKELEFATLDPRHIVSALTRVKNAGLPKICAWYCPTSRYTSITPWPLEP